MIKYWKKKIKRNRINAKNEPQEKQNKMFIRINQMTYKKDNFFLLLDLRYEKQMNKTEAETVEQPPKYFPNFECYRFEPFPMAILYQLYD